MMPYIKQSERPNLDVIARSMKLHIKKRGQLNYLLFKYGTLIEPSYASYSAFMGELDTFMREFYRRVIRPYEDGKILDNGDVV